jgi:integrase
VIGDVPLERVSTAHVEAVLAAVTGSAGTRHRVLATLRAALNAAVKRRQITWNPAVGIDLEPENPPEGKRWTPAEAARFLAHTADDPLGLLYRVMVLSGCRRAELCGFRWAGADLEAGVLTVKRTIVQLGGTLVEEPTAKSRAGDRLVFLDTETAGLLREHRQAQRKARLRAGAGWQDDDLIFCQDDGRPWLPDHISKRFRRLAAQAGA